MDTSAYGYVLLVAGIGMAIVFVFLWFLSGLMSLIRRLFDDHEHSARDKAVAAIDEIQAPPVELRGNNWIIAVVAAFLEAEQLDQSSDPGPWVDGRSHNDDRWLSAPPRSDSCGQS